MTTRAATLADAERVLNEMAVLLDHTDRHIGQLDAVRRDCAAIQARLAEQIADARKLARAARP